MQRWEYKILWLRGNDPQSQIEMSVLGEQGWELVAIYDSNAYFKRPKR